MIGDGTLSIFNAPTASEACGAALQGYAALRKTIPSLNARRSAEDRPTTDVSVGLHVGEVFYGNIGSPADSISRWWAAL
ncbi:class 3 adenylate cyclase [Rhizobium sp. BK399]|nr:class 3 adenylate cyclase [Rhizobium sp. BK399]